MKINRQKRMTTKHLFVAIIIAAVLCVIGWLIYTNVTDEQPSTTSDQTPTSQTTSGDGTSSSTTSNNNGGSSPSSSSDTESTSNYVNTPIAQPSSDAPYPIENAHYSIAQLDSKSFRITLYPIANNSSTSDYNEQLADYKREAIDYLTGRYGGISDFQLTWDPAAANDI